MQQATALPIPVVSRRPAFVLRGDTLAGYLCVGPAVMLILAFWLMPVAFSLAMSLYKWNLASAAPTFVGLQNFERLAASETFWRVVANTLVFSGGSVTLIVLLSLSMALVLDVKVRGISFFRALLFVPHLTPWVIVATLWLFLYDAERGLINGALRALGLPAPVWLQSTASALPALILVKVWKSVGYYTVLFLAGLQSIPQELHEAAKVDGAGIWHRVRHITLPLISPMTLFVVVVAVIGSFQDFEQVLVMTRGGPVDSTNILVWYLYEQAFQNYQVGLGSAVAVVMLVCLLSFTAAKLVVARLWVHY
ncbi:MAG: sugar ABC transporter permease [Chloroflexota bacterium]